MTQRISEVTVSVRRLEAVAPVTTIHWEPSTGYGVVSFEIWNMVYEDDKYVGMVRNDAIPLIEVPVSQLMDRVVHLEADVPAPMDVPVLLISPILKTLFDELYNEKMTALAEAAAQPSPQVPGQRPDTQ